MHCPIDNNICKRKQLDKIEIDVCSKCEGVWLEKSEVSNLTQGLSLPNYTSMDEIISDWEVAESKGTLPKDFWTEDNLECPNDRSQMKKHYFAGSNIGVDQCQICHGFWLDGGELHAVAKYFEPNADLDKAWQMVIRDKKEWDKKLAKLSLLPATMASYAVYLKNPSLGMALVGSFIIKMIVDVVIKSDNELAS